MSALSHAIECAARGWAVFPANQDKTPRTPNGHKAASKDPEMIRALWGQYGGLLVAIRTGEESNLAVLDIDRQHNGDIWWQANRHRLPVTRTHRTRSGGLHLLFKHRPGLRCSTARIARGIDVKAEGGAVIYWPCAGHPVLFDSPLADWPDWLTPPPKPAVEPSRGFHGPRPAAHIEAQLKGLIRTIATAPQGQRNAVLFWGASRAADIIAESELSGPYAKAALAEAAMRTGLEANEASRTIDSALTRRAV